MEHLAFTAMMRLIDGGQCWVKLSAAYQLSKSGAPDYADYRPFARALVAAAPERMLWGTNWPHPKVDFMPDDTDLLETMLNWVDDDATRSQVLTDNPAKLYGFEPIA
jgi:D-galactarolactone isomerase